MTNLGIGQSSCVGIGGDPIIGTSFAEILRLYNDDPDTDIIVFIGEIGGTMEQEAAAYIKESVAKPVCTLIVGATAPPGKRMGHAGAIITGDSARAGAKIAAMRDAGAHIIPTPPTSAPQRRRCCRAWPKRRHLLRFPRGGPCGTSAFGGWPSFCAFLPAGPWMNFIASRLYAMYYFSLEAICLDLRFLR